MLKNITAYLFLFLLITGCTAKDSPVVCVKNVCLKCEISETEYKRMKGLSNRPLLKNDEAMLFIFPEEQKWNFWMKDMNFSLDIIWINSDKRIVEIQSDVPACFQDDCPVLTPAKKAKYVLETNAGFAAKHKVKVNDGIKFSEAIEKINPQ